MLDDSRVMINRDRWRYLSDSNHRIPQYPDAARSDGTIGGQVPPHLCRPSHKRHTQTACIHTTPLFRSDSFLSSSGINDTRKRGQHYPENVAFPQKRKKYRKCYSIGSPRRKTPGASVIRPTGRASVKIFCTTGTDSSGTIKTYPMPMLKVRYISASSTSPIDCIQG
jgi:hypothetical protein